MRDFGALGSSPNRSVYFATLTMVMMGCGGSTPEAVVHTTNLEDASIVSTVQSDAEVTAKSRQSPVLVTIVVDQFASWLADDRLPLLPSTGGFSRLRREGVWGHRMQYHHAVTDTAPGHTALYTGSTPRDSGVYANEVFNGDSKVSILRDEQTRVVTIDGVTQAAGSSAQRIQVDTLADRLRKEHPNAWITSISLKDRGAIPGGGRHPTHVLWHDASRDEFVTSSAFANELPLWAAKLGSRKSLQEARLNPWVPLDGAWLKATSLVADSAAGEGAWPGLTTTFPHDISRAENPAMAFRSSPLGDEAIAELAIEALRTAPLGQAPSLLALSFSSNDYVGHVSGVESWESLENLVRLDKLLAKLFSVLDEKVGKEGWSVVLSADHGVAPMPETAGNPRVRHWCRQPDLYERPCDGWQRLLTSTLVERIRDGVERSGGKKEWIVGFADPYVYLNVEAKKLPPPKYQKLIETIRSTSEKINGIMTAKEVPRSKQDCGNEGDDSLGGLICRSMVVGALGSVYLVPKPGFFFDPEYVPGHGSNHGTPYVYDRTVPILVRAPGRAPLNLEKHEPLSFGTFLRTANAVLNLRPPDESIGGVALIQ